MGIVLFGEGTCPPHPALHELDGQISENRYNYHCDYEEDDSEGGAESLVGLFTTFIVFFAQFITELGQHKLLIWIVESISLSEVVGIPFHYRFCFYDYQHVLFAFEEVLQIRNVLYIILIIRSVKWLLLC